MTEEPASEQDTMKEMNHTSTSNMSATAHTTNKRSAMNTTTYKWQDV
jgi:hypothetical protein